MKNFIAFRFTDNDFHWPLRQAIEYVVENRTEELTIDNFRLFALRGLAAFDALRRIDNEYASRTLGDHADYFEKQLQVSEVDKLTELDDGFEGYVFDRNQMSVYYVGY